MRGGLAADDSRQGGQLMANAKLALRRLASSVSVVTCRHDRRNYAMTATAVSALSMEPPSMLVCVNRSAAFHGALNGASEFAINILSRAHVDISRLCSGGANPESRFNVGNWDTSAPAPILIDAQAAIVRVYNFMEATSQIAQTTLRAVLGQSSLDDLLGGREKINGKLQAIIDRQTEPWGIKVGTVELKDAQLAESMVRALARQAEAEREKRAKIIATEGEFQAAQVLANAAEIISTQPAALALRYMQTLLDMGSNQNSTIVFPIPIELIRPLLAAPVPMKPTRAVTVGNGAPASGG